MNRRNTATLVGVALAILGIGTLIYSWFPSGAQPKNTDISLNQPSAVSTEPRAVAAAANAHDRKASMETALNWDKEARASADHFQFIKAASKAALAGDGRAAYYVAQMLMPCLLAARLYGSAPNPEKEFEAQMATAAIPPQLLEQNRRELHDCAGFMKGEDVFDDLPLRDGGYNSYKFWLDLAYNANDPLAQTEHAALAIGNASAPNPGSIPVAQADINHAIASGDPEAIFRAGFIISNGLYMDRVQGYAISLAACDLGYDCSAKNAALVFGSCVTMSTCPEGTVFSDYVVKNIGADGYALAYSRAQQIEAALAENDRHALEQFAQLNSAVSIHARGRGD